MESGFVQMAVASHYQGREGTNPSYGKMKPEIQSHNSFNPLTNKKDRRDISYKDGYLQNNKSSNSCFIQWMYTWSSPF